MASSLNHPNLNIEQLTIYETQTMSIKSMKYLCDAIKWNTCLQSLAFYLVPLGDEGCEYLADCLSSNTTLKELALQECKMTEKGVMCLGESLLDQNTTLQSLFLSRTHFGDEDGETVGECFGMNSHLVKLSFPRCGLEGEYLCDFLKGTLKNRYLHCLDLSHNTINDDGVKQIAEYVGRNGNLTKLVLGSCSIGVEGGKYLAASLAENTSLLSLYLTDNPIGDEGGMAMAKMIRSNNCLRLLSLNLCGIQKDGVGRICEYLSDNGALLFLHLCFPRSSKEEQEKWIRDISKSKYLIQPHFSRGFRVVDIEFRSKTTKIMERNRRYWRERIYWCCILNVKARGMMVGEWNHFIPPEIIHYILWFVVPYSLVSEGETKRVMIHACNKSTIGGDKKMFLECVFGKGIDILMQRIKG